MLWFQLIYSQILAVRVILTILKFLTSLLTDRDVTGGFLPSFIHKRLFSFIAKKRTPKVLPQYNCIGGFSPIYEDTEALAKTLSSHLDAPVITFHRYLPDTHQQTIQQLKTLGIVLLLAFLYFHISLMLLQEVLCDLSTSIYLH